MQRNPFAILSRLGVSGRPFVSFRHAVTCDFTTPIAVAAAVLESLARACNRMKLAPKDATVTETYRMSEKLSAAKALKFM